MRINRSGDSPQNAGADVPAIMATSQHPAVCWFVLGGDETLSDGSKAKRHCGVISIAKDKALLAYRISFKDPSSGLVAFHTLESLDDLLSEMERLLDSDDLNWLVDKFAKKR